jgi:hypothetical protein
MSLQLVALAVKFKFTPFYFKDTGLRDPPVAP